MSFIKWEAAKNHGVIFSFGLQTSVVRSYSTCSAKGTVDEYSRILLSRQFGNNDAFSSVPAEFLSFTCISVRLYRHFAYSDVFCRSPQNLLFVYNDSCKFSLQFEP